MTPLIHVGLAQHPIKRAGGAVSHRNMHKAQTSPAYIQPIQEVVGQGSKVKEGMVW